MNLYCATFLHFMTAIDSFVHGGNVVEGIVYLLFIASNIFQLFKIRRLRNSKTNQKELARLLIKDMYILKRSKEIVFNSA